MLVRSSESGNGLGLITNPSHDGRQRQLASKGDPTNCVSITALLRLHRLGSNQKSLPGETLSPSCCTRYERVKCWIIYENLKLSGAKT
jgi:hypothetical protein